MARIIEFQVIDHGEDGSQYFPGCGVAYTRYSVVATGVGDTASEALDDALEQIATSGDADFTPEQKAEMRASLSDPDRSAHARCAEIDSDLPGAEADCTDHDWHHYVSVRYNLTEET